MPFAVLISLSYSGWSEDATFGPIEEAATFNVPLAQVRVTPLRLYTYIYPSPCPVNVPLAHVRRRRRGRRRDGLTPFCPPALPLPSLSSVLSLCPLSLSPATSLCFLSFSTVPPSCPPLSLHSLSLCPHSVLSLSPVRPMISPLTNKLTLFHPLPSLPFLGHGSWVMCPGSLVPRG